MLNLHRTLYKISPLLYYINPRSVLEARAPLATQGVRGKGLRLLEPLDRDPNSGVTSTSTGDAIDDVPASNGRPPMGLDGGVCWCVRGKIFPVLLQLFV